MKFFRKYVSTFLLGIACVGCAKPVFLGELQESMTVQEYYVDRYKLRHRILPNGVTREYLYTLALLDPTDESHTLDINATISVSTIKLRSNRRGTLIEKIILTRIQPIKGSLANDYDYRYRFKMKGRYEFSCLIQSINGIILEKDLRIYFEQTVR